MSNIESKIGEDRLGANSDAIYELLMSAHEGLSEQESQALNIRLVLIMANEIGDLDRLEMVMSAAQTVDN